MQQAFERTINLIGEDGFEKLTRSRVAVIGLGGVGGSALEVLARACVGQLTLADGDKFENSNLNRQILCTVESLGKFKAEIAACRVNAINPQAHVKAVTQFVDARNLPEILSDVDYCIDAIDDIKNKTALICECKHRGIYIVSAMGAGNRLDCDFKVTDIYKTKDDPLARKLRHELRVAGVDKLDVVCASAPPIVRTGTPFSASAPPFVMGGILGGHLVRRIINS